MQVLMLYHHPASAVKFYTFFHKFFKNRSYCLLIYKIGDKTDIKNYLGTSKIFTILNTFLHVNMGSINDAQLQQI